MVMLDNTPLLVRINEVDENIRGSCRVVPQSVTSSFRTQYQLVMKTSRANPVARVLVVRVPTLPTRSEMERLDV